ncbi:hypothetical protein ACLKA7_002765 [Drosophila subpalustris]
MVLVSNEWQSNKDDEQKSNVAASTATTTTTATTTATSTPTTTTAIAATASVAVVNKVSSSEKSSDQELTARPGTHIIPGVPAVDISKRQQRINKKALTIMELNRKTEQDQLLLREKHETETCELPTENISNSNSSNSNSNNTNSNNTNSNINSNDANDNLENQENNNITATEICDSNTNTLQGHLAQQQVQLHLAINSVLNSSNNTTTSNNLFSSMGALQMPNEAVTNSAVVPGAEMTPGEAKIILQCEGKSHKFETRTICLAPNQECKVGRLIAKSKASEGNAIFDCKVLSRNHAMLWYTADGRFWVKDTKSSNGTFINDNKLGNEPAELHYGDTVKFGVEVIENSRQEVHGCIIARVTLFLPDGREAISIESDQMQPAGPNRISYDEIQRLNAFLQEASQREKMLKAKLSSLQGVLDSTRKNSFMCWQSMISEDQLIHKINLLEKKLQMMEKNVPENALRNEIVKLLDDKTAYQLTAKEALRKVYQDRCDAMQMLSKMETAYTTSDNECSILRAQIVSSKQTLQDFNSRLEMLQLEYAEYKQETQRQQQEAKELEEQRLEQLREHLNGQEIEMEQLRQQLMRLQQTKAEYDSEQALQEQQALEQLNAVLDLGDDDDDDDNDDDDEDDDKVAGDQKKGDDDNELQTTPSKQKSSKKSKRQLKDEFDLKHKVVRKDTMMKWLKNSDLNKGADGGDVLNAIVNNADSGDEEHDEKPLKGQRASPTSELSAGTKQETEAETASDEFIHKSPKHTLLNGIQEMPAHGIHNKLETQQTLMHDADLPQEHAIDMLQEECTFYKQKSQTLTNDISELQDQMKLLREQLQKQQEQHQTEQSSISAETTEGGEQKEQLEPNIAKEDIDGELSSSWREELNTINDEEREEELIVYKERLEQSEMSNLQLRDEISKLRLKQPIGYDNLLYRRALPLGAMALAVIIYFLTTRI